MNKKKRERIIAAVVVLAFELAVTALITVAVGVVLVPMVEAQRGYNAIHASTAKHHRPHL